MWFICHHIHCCAPFPDKHMLKDHLNLFHEKLNVKVQIPAQKPVHLQVIPEDLPLQIVMDDEQEDMEEAERDQGQEGANLGQEDSKIQLLGADSVLLQKERSFRQGSKDMQKILKFYKLISIINEGHQEYHYKCKDCGRLLLRKVSLHQHLRTHTGEKPFACKDENCPKRFSVINNMRKHYKTMHLGIKVPRPTRKKSKYYIKRRNPAKPKRKITETESECDDRDPDFEI